MRRGKGSWSEGCTFDWKFCRWLPIIDCASLCVPSGMRATECYWCRFSFSLTTTGNVCSPSPVTLSFTLNLELQLLLVHLNRQARHFALENCVCLNSHSSEMVLVVVITELLPLAALWRYQFVLRKLFCQLSSASFFFLPAAIEHRQCYLQLILVIMTISHYILAFQVFCLPAFW